MAAVRLWFVLTLVACGSSHHDKPDAPAGDAPADLAIDVPADAAADAPADAPIDAAPDLDPSCPSAPTILVDVDPRRIDTMANVANVLYVSAHNPSNASDNVVLTLDAGTGASLASPLVPAASVAVWPGPDAAYAAEGRANGSIWRLVPGHAPVELITGRASPGVVTSDGTYVYWSEGSTVERRLIAGGSIEPVMTGCTMPSRLVVDASELYCLEFQNGDVKHVAKDGSGTVITLATDGYPAVTLVEDATNLYVANMYNNPRVFSGPKPSGPLGIVTQSPDLGRYLGLAVAPYHFYVANQEGYVEEINRATHAVHKINILNNTTYGSPSLDPILWNDQLLVAASAYTTSGIRYVLHCVH